MSAKDFLPRRRVWTIIVGGGSGTRFGRPKQFERIGSGTDRVIDRSVNTALAVSDGVVVVVPPDVVDRERQCFSSSTQVVVVAGGDSRTHSVRAGLDAVADDAEVICVHDAARPNASTALFDRVIEAVFDGADAAIPGVGLVDTIKRVDRSGWVTETVDRDTLVAVQTPQAFAAPMLRTAHRRLGEATDDAGLVEDVGGRVRVVAGEVDNVKITHRDDLERVRPAPAIGDTT